MPAGAVGLVGAGASSPGAGMVLGMFFSSLAESWTDQRQNRGD